MPIRTTVLAAAFALAGLLDVQCALAQPAPSETNNWDSFLKFYPPRAIAAREEGAVGFRVTLDGKGAVTGCEVTRSSGHPLLDDETCRLISLHAEFKPDRGLSPSQVRTSEGVIAWKLPGATTVMASGASLQAPPEKVVCKKNLRTGTLADFERICMTPNDWAKQSDEQKAVWEDIGKKGTTSGKD